MLIRLFSDIHWEADDNSDGNFWMPPGLPSDAETILVLSGDLWLGVRSIPNLEALGKRFAHVIVVLGNHDYWYHTLGGHTGVAENMQQVLKKSNIHVLHRDAITLEGYRFVGATLWTDFNKCNPLVMENSIGKMWRDYTNIQCASEAPWFTINFTPEIWLEEHKLDFEFIRKEVAQSALPVVVVTHHAPSEQSSHARYAGNPDNFYFCSELGNWIAEHGQKIALWLHGHMHSHADYRIGNTRILCNPRGYRGVEGTEVTGFDPYCILAIGDNKHS